MLGNGDGTFQAQVTYATDDGPAGIVVADFNHDGKLDIATSNYYAADVSVLLGNGDGTFQAEVTYTVGNEPRTLTSGDFNGDGNIDLAVANQGDNTVSILFGNGDGTFQAQLLYPVGISPQGLAVADFNGDGIPDLAIGNSGTGGETGNLGIMLGQEGGGFGNMTAYTAGNGPLGPVVADFNGDGFPDIAIENFNDGTESVLLGNGDGTFQTQSTFPAGTNPYAAAVGGLQRRWQSRIWQFPTSAATTRPSCSTSSPRPRPRYSRPSRRYGSSGQSQCSRQLSGQHQLYDQHFYRNSPDELRAATSGDNPHSDG